MSKITPPSPVQDLVDSLLSSWADTWAWADSPEHLRLGGHTDPLKSPTWLMAISAYDDYFKAYSVAVMGGKERSELLYGGKSELAHLMLLETC